MIYDGVTHGTVLEMIWKIKCPSLKIPITSKGLPGGSTVPAKHLSINAGDPSGASSWEELWERRGCAGPCCHR